MTEEVDMPEQAEAPVGATPGITVDAITLSHCSFTDLMFDLAVKKRQQVDGPSDGGDEVEIDAQVNIWTAGDPSSMLVALRVTVEPTSQPTWVAVVEMVGQFSFSENPAVPAKRFAQHNGVAYLVPYVRERLSSLVSASVYGGFVLPPISVPEILKMSSESKARERQDEEHAGQTE